MRFPDATPVAPQALPTATPLARDPLAEALRSLRRAVSTVRSYPAGNDLTERALGDLATRFGAALPTRLHFALGAISDPDGRAIPADEGLSTLIGDLYRDGVRELRLDARLARPELDRFVAALATPIDSHNLTEDYVTRLWEAELPSVSVVALDPYLDRDVPGDVLEGKTRPSGELEGVPVDLPRSIPAPPEEAFRLSEIDRENLATELALSTGAPPWPAFVATVLEVLESPIAERRAADLVLLVESALYRLVSDGQLLVAVDLLRGALADKRLQSAALADVVARATREERLQPLRDVVAADASSQPAARELCQVLGVAALPVLCGFLSASSAVGARRFWAETIAALGPAGIEALGRLVAGPDAEIAATAARVIVASGEARFGPALWTAYGASTGAARRDLLRAAIALRPDPERLIEAGLKDRDDDCRLIALGGLPAIPNAKMEARLLQRLTASDAVALSEREKDALFRALAGIGDARAVAFFEKQLSGSWLSSASRAEQTRAARALVRMASPLAAESLRAKAAGRGAVAELCQRALREKPGRAS